MESEKRKLQIYIYAHLSFALGIPTEMIFSLNLYPNRDKEKKWART
jgi:hypothetical protein